MKPSIFHFQQLSASFPQLQATLARELVARADAAGDHQQIQVQVQGGAALEAVLLGEEGGVVKGGGGWLRMFENGEGWVG